MDLNRIQDNHHAPMQPDFHSKQADHRHVIPSCPSFPSCVYLLFPQPDTRAVSLIGFILYPIDLIKLARCVLLLFRNV